MVRPLQFGIVATVRGRVRGDEVAVEAADWAESLLTPEFFSAAPFKTISLIVVFGTETRLQTQFGRRLKDELPITVEVEMEKLRRIRGFELEDAFRYIIT